MGGQQASRPHGRAPKAHAATGNDNSDPTGAEGGARIARAKRFKPETGRWADVDLVHEQDGALEVEESGGQQQPAGIKAEASDRR